MKYSCLFFVLYLCAVPAMSKTPFRVEFEGGYLLPGRADIRIPGDVGTRFSLTDDLSVDDTVYTRFRVSWRSAPRHYWALTLVPLKATASGTLPGETLFMDKQFPANTPANASYQFNNYRLTYRYRLKDTDYLDIDFGGTIFVRDARVTLESGGLRDSDYNLGLVPLLSFGLVWKMWPDLFLVLDGDALVATQGRAVDMLCALRYNFNDNLGIDLGYRLLEGGADNDDVYTFALFNHVLLSVGWNF